MVVYFECPECACACACTDFQVAGAVACERCGRRVKVPRWARHGAMARQSDAGGNNDPEQRRAPDRSLIPTPAPLAGRISHHIERTLGPCPMVLHHTLAPDEQLDLHVVPPHSAGERAALSSSFHGYTLATSGLSSRRPNPRSRRRTPAPLAELLISLPSDWPGLRPDGMFDHQAIRLPQNSWPVEWIKSVAGMLFGHLADASPGTLLPPKLTAPLVAPGTKFTGVLLAPSVLHARASTLMVHDDLMVSFLALWPLYSEELRLARRNGADELLARFAAHGITDVIAPNRPNVGM